MMKLGESLDGGKLIAVSMQHLQLCTLLQACNAYLCLSYQSTPWH